MKRIIVLLVLVAMLVAPFTALAQDPNPGEGGLIIEGSTRTSANLTSLIPIKCSGVDCANPYALMFPSMLAVGPETQNFEIGYPGSLVTDVQISDDELTYTFTLRDDMTWTDGTPVTAGDLYFSYLALQHIEDAGISSSFSRQARDIVSAEVIDDYTIALSLETPSCQAFSSLNLPVTPSHAYGWDMSMGDDFDWSTMVNNALDLNPTVTHGPFKFNRLEPGTAIYLQADQNYADPTNGVGVLPEGYVFLDTPDEPVMIERFLSFRSGEPNYIREPNQFQAILDSDAQYLNEAGRTWHYVALNLADPDSPANGLDEDGNPVDQGHHPIFGDVRVRQALQHAMNIDEIINGPHNGNATAMTAGTIPSAWTLHPTLERRAFDLDAARALLDEAGWKATGTPLCDGCDGLRIADGALYAEDGTEFYFELMNVGDIRNDVAVVLQDQFAQIGVDVEVMVLDFNTMYDVRMGNQDFDAAVAGWRGSLPFDADQRSFFGADTDIFGEGYGFNFPSYYNAEFEGLAAQVNTLPGCDEEARKEIAWRMQEILWEEQPYLWLYALNSVYAASPAIENFDPYPNFGQWNADAWIVKQ